MCDTKRLSFRLLLVSCELKLNVVFEGLKKSGVSG